MRQFLISGILAGVCVCALPCVASTPGIAALWQEALVSDSAVTPYSSPAMPVGKIQDEMVKPAKKEQLVSLIMPSSVTEGGEPKMATLKLTYPEKVSITFKITGYPQGGLKVPKSVKLKAGETSVSFKFSVKDDDATTLNQFAGIKLSVPEFKFEILNICPSFDNEKPPAIKLAVPASFKEGDNSTKKGAITLSRPLDKDGFVDLVQSPRDRLIMPERVFIPSGKKSVNFSISSPDNEIIEGNRSIELSVKAGPSVLARTKTTLLDDDKLLLAFDLPETVSEGSGVKGKVSIPGITGKDLKVDLSAVNGSALSFPASVTIPSGSGEATFLVKGRQNTWLDGTRKTIISAKTGNVSAPERELIVMDDDVASYRISLLDGVLNPGQPLKIKVAAVDVEGNQLAGFSGSVNLGSVISGGDNQPTSPSLVQLSSGYWTGKVTLPVTSSLITGLTAGDAGGRKGETSHIESVRTLGLKAVDLVWDPVRERIYASVPTGGIHQVVAIDPKTMKVTGGTATGQTPGKLAITSGGEYLYVALKGNGTIAKIDPSTMTVVATFPVGSDGNGLLHAADIAPVQGQPDLLIATRSPADGNTASNSVAVYDNGVPRQAVTPVRSGSNFIHPSSDPTVFFDFNNQWLNNSMNVTRRMLKLTAGGISEQPESRISRIWWSSRTRTYGDMIFFPEGDAYDGVGLKPLGKYCYGGTVCPDVAGHRVFYLERYVLGTSSGASTKVMAYDPVTQNFIDGLDMPAISEDPVDFIRWGENGLAFCTSDTLTLVNSPRLVPGGAAADLAATIEIPSSPPAVGEWVKCGITVTNRGPNPASNASVATRFSGNVEIRRASASTGLYEIISNGANLAVGELGVGMSASLELEVTSKKVASIGCTVSARSGAADPDFSNSGGYALINYGYRQGPDALNKVNLVGCGQIHDATRNLIWISIGSSVELNPTYPSSGGSYERYYDPVSKIKPPVSRSVVSMDPHNGRISTVIPLKADPTPGAMALSDDGRYLYVGLRDIGEISRIDLQSSPPEITRIILPRETYGEIPQASDIEVLGGDGTSIIVAMKSGSYVAVIDGLIPRRVKVERTGFSDTNSIISLNKTADPAVFTGVGAKLYLLYVTPEGVWVNKTREQPHGGHYSSSGSGELWMWNMHLFEVRSLNQVVNLLPFSYGYSILENARNRVYFLDATKIRSFDTLNRSETGQFAVADYEWQLNERSFMRWGDDGFSILNNDGVFLARWALAAPVVSAPRLVANTGRVEDDPTADTDGDGIPNAFEQLFATSPVQFDPNPVSIAGATAGGGTVIHVRFPRRVGMGMSDYGYEISQDMKDWKPVEAVSEVILPLQPVNGVEVESIEATIMVPDSGRGFVRLRWR